MDVIDEVLCPVDLGDVKLYLIFLFNSHHFLPLKAEVCLVNVESVSVYLDEVFE